MLHPIALLTSMGPIVTFVIALSILVFVHEGGHFLVARWCGVGVRAFALGFGPALLSWRSKRTGTLYRLNLVPIGGYCLVLGEDASDENGQGVRGLSYVSRTAWQRLAIVFAGPLVNLLFAFVALWVGAMLVGTPQPTMSTEIGRLVPNDPAQRAGLQLGDTVLAIDGRAITTGEQLVATINAALGKTLTIHYRHAGRVQDVVVRPIALQRGTQRIGIIGISPREIFRPLAPLPALTAALKTGWTFIAETGQGLAGLVVHPAQAASGIAGPIGIARVGIAVQSYGIASYIGFVALLSVSLGMFNLVPLPGLDGGRAFFILLEMLRGRPLEARREAMVHVAGFAVLLAVVACVTYRDIFNIVIGKAPL